LAESVLREHISHNGQTRRRPFEILIAKMQTRTFRFGLKEIKARTSTAAIEV
jgi:hypothetical protein